MNNGSFWNDPITVISTLITNWLTGLGLSLGLATFIVYVLGAFILALGAMFFVVFLIWYERKLIGRFQDRLGPNRVGPWGIIQPFADMVKIFTKEYITPVGADKIPYNLAPILLVASVLMIWAVIPFTNRVWGVNINVGVLYIIAVGAIGSLAIIMAGWSSNNKYALLGAFRMVAMMISYEVPMVMSLLVPVLLARSMGMNELVQAQGIWFLFIVPIPALIFFITSLAEVSRSPFDLLEAESEIVAGINIEYSGLKFGIFYVAEFLHAFTVSLLFAVIFMGGWRGPFVDQVPLLGVIYLFIKAFIISFIGIWIRGSLPRFRIDQMMDLNWKILTPISLVALMAIAVAEKLAQGLPMVWHALVLLGVNVVIGAAALEVARQVGRRKRAQAAKETGRTEPYPMHEHYSL
ncbi:MAG TPA: NADH-quinone oxidoreductase subunit NuoH [Anaerolineaceae bacterium]|nr:NADH-quinone oxidoreductase subunit NuoH [Anaerolineaceae bacterium]